MNKKSKNGDGRSHGIIRCYPRYIGTNMKISVKIRGRSQGTFQIKTEFGQSGNRGLCQRI